MAMTITNTNSLNLLSILTSTSNKQSDVMTRLSTGSRINNGKDDPAGLIAMRGMDMELRATDAALSNNQRTDAMLNVADSAMGEISSMLNDVMELAQKSANSAGLSASELSANQAQIDNAIAAIDRLVNDTEFNGKKLLDGSLGVTVTGGGSKMTDISVYSREDSSTDVKLDVDIDAAAERALVDMSTAAISANSSASLSVQGSLGTAVVDFEALTSGYKTSAVAAEINEATAETGVCAYVSSTRLYLRSSEYGSQSFVRVQTVDGDENGNLDALDAKYDEGVDAKVTVNGQAAAVDGLRVNYSGNGLSMAFDLSTTFGTTTSSNNELTIQANGGATFQLGTDSNSRTNIGIQGMQTSRLGSNSSGYLASLKSGGANDLLSDPAKAAEIAKAAASQVATAQGRLGGFNKFQVQTSINQLNSSKEGLTSARSTIADVDYATETAELSRQNVLMQSAMSLLGMANQQSSNILSLLR